MELPKAYKYHYAYRNRNGIYIVTYFRAADDRLAYAKGVKPTTGKYEVIEIRVPADGTTIIQNLGLDGGPILKAWQRAQPGYYWVRENGEWEPEVPDADLLQVVAHAIHHIENRPRYDLEQIRYELVCASLDDGGMFDDFDDEVEKARLENEIVRDRIRIARAEEDTEIELELEHEALLRDQRKRRKP